MYALAVEPVISIPFLRRRSTHGLSFMARIHAEVRDATHPEEAGTSTLTLQHRTGPPTVSTLDWKVSVRANLEQFALAIEGRAAYPFTEEQIVSNIAVMAAVSQSLTGGRGVSVEMLGA